MARTVSLNGTNYSVPEPGDTGYAQTLSSYLLALATAFPQLANSVQQALGAELDLGSLFGIKGLYFKTQTANPGATGVLRLAKTDSVVWRNNANTADLALGISGTDVMQFNGASFLSAPLSAEVDFGATAGFKTLVMKSRAATIAAAGLIRMAGTAAADIIAWRNNANTADLNLTVNASDQLLFNGSVVTTGGGTANPLIAPGTASLGLEGAQTDGATAIGVKIGNSNALVTAGAKIAAFYSDAITTEKANVALDGTLVSDKHKAFTATSVTVQGNMADGASAIGVILDNANALANATAKALSIRTGGAEKSYVDINGYYRGPTASVPVLMVDTSVTSITNGVGVRTIAVFTNVIVDSDSGYSTGTGRYTVPTGKGGLYLISATVTFAVNPTASTYVELWKNAAFHRVTRYNYNVYAANMAPALVALAAGDIVDIRVGTGDAAAQALGNPSGANSSTAAGNWLMIQRVGV